MASKEEKRIKNAEIKKDAERYQFLREYFGQLVVSVEEASLVISLKHNINQRNKLRLAAMGINPELRKIEAKDIDQRVDEWIESFRLKTVEELKVKKTVRGN